MFLGVDKLLELVKTKKLVEDLCERELTNPEGCGFDLRLGKIWKIKGSGFLGVDDRKTCDIELVAEYNGIPAKAGNYKNKNYLDRSRIKCGMTTKKNIVIKPGDFFLVTTIEKVNVPTNLVGILKPRSTLQRMGLMLRTTQIAPGYSGELTFALHNSGPATVKIEMGARIVHVLFAKVFGQTSIYRGQWQGGRVTAHKKEKQI